MKRLKTILMTSLLTATVFTTPIFAKTTNNDQMTKTDIQVYDMSIDSGSYKGTQYTSSYILNKNNGSKINFYVENYASEPVIIEINNTSRTLKAGQKGHISANVTKSKQEFKFRARAGGNGGDVNISYIIKQRN